ncbi:undecaprenyl-diphosphate phosphatase [Nannocystis sp. ILAH1]|uniref:undecaprenyl-diphosphate phosphatase n=1 Tax=Nannocystis sp. ILAH1 TaxID=2996789 RepID=UPI00226D9439|nr:undecaprenyl-diphosphate phosphatase [Nannocystis sp. ILAH1]MCY0990227.1 undecaprenyl-diphosphate phosphatase [Nannocystis sp. ILAH1]
MSAPDLSLGLAALLGALQGVAEFLPISSSGHLALAERVAGLEAGAGGHSFNIVVHAGTLLAVLIHYRDDLLAIARGVLRPGHASKDVPDATGASGHAPSDSFNSARGTTDHAESVPVDSFRAVADSPLPAAREATDPAGHVPADSSVARGVTDPAGHVPADSHGRAASGSSATDARALFLALVIGTLPLAAALAPPVEGLVIATEHYPKAIGVCFLVTAAMLGFAEWRTRRQQRPQEVPRPLQALLIGLAQLVAILPGISRSGSTIAAAMALGLGRLPAARFSFLLAIPAILGASLKEAIGLMKHGLPAADPLAFIVGFLVSFVVGVATLRVLLVLLVRVGVLPFVPYLVVLGLAVLALG